MVIIVYAYDDGEVMIEYFNPKEQLAYSYSNAWNAFAVTSYYDFESIVKLAFRSQTYRVTINFQFMDGWDQITCGNEGSYYCDLANEGTTVFDNYNIR